MTGREDKGHCLGTGNTLFMTLEKGYMEVIERYIVTCALLCMHVIVNNSS